MLHSDNGKPMRANTMIATLQWLGVFHQRERLACLKALRPGQVGFGRASRAKFIVQAAGCTAIIRGLRFSSSALVSRCLPYRECSPSPSGTSCTASVITGHAFWNLVEVFGVKDPETRTVHESSRPPSHTAV